MLCASGISVSFGRHLVLDRLDFCQEGATIVGLVAPNGSGKTTLLRTLAGLIPQQKGRVTVDEVSPFDRSAFYRKLFFVEDSAILNPLLTPYDYLRYVKSRWHSKRSLDAVIEMLALSRFAKKPIAKLSLGMKQQTVIALCLISDADYLLLDEPMNGLDPGNTLIVSEQLRALRDAGKAILMSSHLLNNIDSLADEVLFLKDGGIAHKLVGNGDSSTFALYQTFYLKG